MTLPDIDELTDEQRAVVAHRDGPAVVQAVPGAGKTTALAHRVRGLVSDGVPSGRILVSSFSRATVGDLEHALSSLGVDGAETRTLHALGLIVIRRAGDSPPDTDLDPAAQGRVLARQALTRLATERNVDTADLGRSATDLADRIAAWKQALAYPDLDAADLPPGARKHAHEIDPDDEDLRVLYQRFEEERQRRGWRTYADMLRTGWRLLATRPSLREALQARYDHVLVDEFQDVGRAQYRLLHHLAAAHHNYMAVGDADQCIYGWRGADPSYLRDFAGTYDAATYRMTDSFRCPAGPLVLANGVIEQAVDRPPTRLHLTQGFAGDAALLTPDDRRAAARQLANRVQALHDEGIALSDIAMLVRTYGQTPPLERALIEQNVPYRLTGAPPFYERRAVQTLLRYLYWALLERRRRDRNGFASEHEAGRYAERFGQILKRPTRYVPHERIRRIERTVQRHGTSALDVLADHQSALPESTAGQVDHFRAVADTLVDRLDDPPRATLHWLTDAIEYASFLRETSAVPHRADDRVRTARALIRYAGRHDTAPHLLSDIHRIAQRQRSQRDGADALDLRSIHRAKGREWPVVVVPDCVDGTIPLDRDDTEKSHEAEERRLLYVALTRARRRLLLSCRTDADPSPFLADADAAERLDTCRAVGTALRNDPESLSDRDVVRLCRGVVELGLERYVRRWWSPSDNQRAALRDRLAALRPRIDAATRRLQAYRQAQAATEAARRRAGTGTNERLAEVRDQVGTAPLSATNEGPETYYPADARFTFDWVDGGDRVGIFWDGDRVGTLSPLGRHRLDAGTTLALPWPSLVGAFEGVRRGRSVLAFRIDWAATESQWAQEASASVEPPVPPSDLDQMLCSDAFREGYTLFRSVLTSNETPPTSEGAEGTDVSAES